MGRGSISTFLLIFVRDIRTFYFFPFTLGRTRLLKVGNVHFHNSSLGATIVSGSSDEGESTSGTPAGGGTGGSGENQEMEENGTIRGGSNNSAGNLVYGRDLKTTLHASTHDLSQDYNPQSRPYQRGYSPAMDKPSYEKEQHRPPSSRDEEKPSSWEYGEKTERKEYSRSRESLYRSEAYRE